jgi:hypothetical protein
MNHKWVAQDGHIFSEKVTLKNNKDFRNGRNFECQDAIAFNVGDKLAKHIVELHNNALVAQLVEA